MSVSVIPEGVDELQVSAAIDELLYFSVRSDDFVAERRSVCRILHHPFCHLAIRVADDANGLAVEAAFQHLAGSNLVSVAVKFAFPTPDWHYHGGASRLLPMHIGPRGDC
jgi:hypothetical protein